jgi:hypothetical protein
MEEPARIPRFPRNKGIKLITVKEAKKPSVDKGLERFLDI